ncbi:MAG: 2-hydroxyacyl-CoA dehydratase family protein [Bacillota bacterium]
MIPSFYDGSSGVPAPRKRAGYFCTYTPVEILAAAGFAPLRLEPPQAAGDELPPYLAANLCSFARACLTGGVRGVWGKLDLIVVAGSCTAMVHLYSAWRATLPSPPVYFLDVPRRSGEEAATFFAAQLRRLASVLGLPSGSAGEVLLREAVERYVRQRILLRELCGPLSCAGAVYRRAVLRAAERAPAELPTAPPNECYPPAPAGPAIFLTGCVVPDDIVSLVEECGLRVAMDDSCAGSRPLQVGDEAAPSGEEDLFFNLARRYLNRAPCPRMTLESRLAYLRSIIKSIPCAGMIYFALKFCDFAMHDFPQVRAVFEEAGLPAIFLQGEYGDAATGQMRTRVEAFAELLHRGWRS